MLRTIPGPDPGPPTVGVIGDGLLGRSVAAHAARSALPGILSAAGGRARIGRIGGTVRAGTLEQATACDIVVLAVPVTGVPLVAARIGLWAGRIVVDATSSPPGARPAGGETDSERVARQLPGALLVKAFNAVPAPVIAARPRHRAGRRAVFYAGDDARANDLVAELIERLGFAAIDVGLLREGGRLLQPGGHLHGLVGLAQD